MRGDVDATARCVSELGLATDAAAQAALAALRVLEATRAGRAAEAVGLARAALAASGGAEPLRSALSELCVLLAYSPEQLAAEGNGVPEGVRWLLAPAQRAALADALNEAALGEAEVGGEGLAGVARHLGACEGLLRELSGGQGERFELDSL